MIKLTKQELINITNKACALYNADINENNVLVFEEVGGDVKPVLLIGSKINGKCDLFPRGENPNMHIYAHLSALYGMDDAF